MLFSEVQLSESLKAAKRQLTGMKFEVSAEEELAKVNAEISRLQRCKKTLENAIASKLLKP